MSPFSAMIHVTCHIQVSLNTWKFNPWNGKKWFDGKIQITNQHPISNLSTAHRVGDIPGDEEIIHGGK